MDRSRDFDDVSQARYHARRSGYKVAKVEGQFICWNSRFSYRLAQTPEGHFYWQEIY